jgi:hypothetical protein
MSAVSRQPLTLFSTVTNLAYWAAERFYGQCHHVWCAPAPAMDRFVPYNPPSSDPIQIYWSYHGDIVGGDEHSAMIAANRLGPIRGAAARCAQGMVDEGTRQLIEATVKRAPLTAFKPLLLVIPYSVVCDVVTPAEPGARAGVMAEEYIIEHLARTCFDILELRR